VQFSFCHAPDDVFHDAMLLVIVALAMQVNGHRLWEISAINSGLSGHTNVIDDR